MAIYNTLSPGGPYTLVANTIYALPACRVMVQVGAGGGTCNVATTDGGTFTAVTLVSQAFETAAAFIKATSADTIVTVHRE